MFFYSPNETKMEIEKEIRSYFYHATCSVTNSSNSPKPHTRMPWPRTFFLWPSPCGAHYVLFQSLLLVMPNHGLWRHSWWLPPEQECPLILLPALCPHPLRPCPIVLEQGPFCHQGTCGSLGGRLLVSPSSGCGGWRGCPGATQHPVDVPHSPQPKVLSKPTGSAWLCASLKPQ